MQRDFVQRYTHLNKEKPQSKAVLRNIFDWRFIFFMVKRSIIVFQNLQRRHSRGPAVDDHRHGNSLYMPIAISVGDLRNILED